MAINIGIQTGWPIETLSNFAATTFVIDFVQCASVEGFIQALKFSSQERQKQVCGLVGREAKFAGKKAGKKIQREGKVWWRGIGIEFRSRAHFDLIERALRAKFTQCEKAKEALLSTQNEVLTHDLGHPESPHTSLPAQEFIRILIKIRKVLQDA